MKALKIIGNTILWLFLIFAILMTVLSLLISANADGIPFVFGNGIVSVQSDSMSGTFEDGDVIVISEVSAAEKSKLKVDDIISYKADLDGNPSTLEVNTHRIVDIKTGAEINAETGDAAYGGSYVYYYTQGDNKATNPVKDDEPVRYDQVLGKYNGTRLAGLGNAFDWIKTPTNFLICIVVPLVLFFLYEVYRFVILIVKANARKAASQSEEEIKRKAVEEYLAQKGGEAPVAEEVVVTEEVTAAPEEVVVTEEVTAVPEEASQNPDDADAQ